MNLAREQNRLLRYIRHQRDVFDYYADNLMDGDEYIASIGVVVMCDEDTLDRLVTYKNRYCPNMRITLMSEEEYRNRGNNDD